MLICFSFIFLPSLPSTFFEIEITLLLLQTYRIDTLFLILFYCFPFFFFFLLSKKEETPVEDIGIPTLKVEDSDVVDAHDEGQSKCQKTSEKTEGITQGPLYGLPSTPRTQFSGFPVTPSGLSTPGELQTVISVLPFQ